jgi:hypothetical protein
MTKEFNNSPHVVEKSPVAGIMLSAARAVLSLVLLPPSPLFGVQEAHPNLCRGTESNMYILASLSARKCSTSDFVTKPAPSADFSATSVNSSASRFSPLDWLLDPTKKGTPTQSLLAALIRLEAYARKDSQIGWAEDCRQAWVAYSHISEFKSYSEANEWACFQMFRETTAQQRQRILDNRHYKLGPEYSMWYSADGTLRPDIPKIPSTSAHEIVPTNVEPTGADAIGLRTKSASVPISKKEQSA